MPFLKNLKVLTQLILGFSAVVVMMVGLGTSSLFEVSGENTHVTALRDNWLPGVRTSLQMQADLRAIRFGEYRVSRTASPAETKDIKARITASIADYQRASAEYAKLNTVTVTVPEPDPAERAAYADIQTVMPQYLDLDRQVVTLAEQNKPDEVMDLMRGQTSTLRDAIEKKTSRRSSTST